MYVYFTENCDPAICETTSVHRLFYPIITRFETLFKSFLDNILFWQNSRINVIPPRLKISGTEVWPQYNGPVGCNSGVIVCMLMRNLVLDLPNQIKGNLHDTCMKYRRFMADEFYAARA
ncbi:hypothetical protein R6Q59_029902 [Mikania micrantha]